MRDALDLPKVMISINPQFVDLILSGRKIIEVRKTFPQIDPCICYIYETKGSRLFAGEGGHKVFQGRGKVVGQLVYTGALILDKIAIEPWSSLRDLQSKRLKNIIRQSACLTEEQLKAYARGEKCYGWVFEFTAKFKEPKDLSEFGLKRPPQSWCYVKEAAR